MIFRVRKPETLDNITITLHKVQHGKHGQTHGFEAIKYTVLCMMNDAAQFDHVCF